MFNLKTYLNFLGRNKLYTFVNVFGLSVSLAFVILIANHTINEFTTDGFNKNADQIYVLCNEQNISTAYRIGERLSSRYPEIEKVCGTIHTDFMAKIMDNTATVKALAVDSTFLDMFSFKLLRGDKKQILKTKHDILISESFARKMFGNEDPIGNSVIAQDSIVYTINGVIEDFKNSMFMPQDIVMRVENMEYYNSYAIGERFATFSTLFFQITKGSNIKTRESEIAEYFKTFFWKYKKELWKKVSFIPMRDLYFNEIEQIEWKKNDMTTLTISVLVSMLILLFAVINYINLTVAQTGFRAKEMATRRLFGSSSNEVLGKMIVESSFLCFVAFLLGYLIAFAVEPYASTLMRRDLLLSENISIGWALLSALFIALLGAISGVIPAIVISRFQPIDVVKGTFAFKSKMTFSKVFITIQSVITVILIACSITIYKQVSYMLNYDYGYNHKAIIDVSTFAFNGKEEAFRDKLKALPSVKSVGFTLGTPLDEVRNSFKVVDVEEPIYFQFISSDLATFKMLDIEILKDNHLAEKGHWINETTLEKLGATDELKSFKIERNGRSTSEWEIAGVVKDLTLGDLVSTGGRKISLLWTIEEDVARSLSVLIEIQGDLVQGYRDVKRTFEEFTDGAEFTGEYMSTQIKHRYYEQQRIRTIMVIFSIVAMIISSLGLLAISSYFIQQRSREIAVRKVFGATRIEVLTLVIWEFMRLAVIAFIIACPIIWYAMSQWLNDFPHRIDMSIWILLVAGLFNLVIAFLTVYWQSNKVANTNPIKAIHE